MKKKLNLSILTMSITAILLTGCGGSGSYSAMGSALDSDSIGFTDYSIESYSNSYDEAEYDSDYDYNSSNSSNQEIKETNNSLKLDESKIVYRGNIDISTSNFDESRQKLQQLMDANGAVLDSDSVHVYDHIKSEDISLRIPCENFKTFTDSVGDIGDVTTNNVYADNITKEYINVKARIETYKQKVARLESLLAMAESVQDITYIYDQLNDAEYQLESAQAQLMNMDLDVAYSYMNISLTDTHKYTETGKIQGTGTFISDLTYSFYNSISGFITFVESLIIALVYAAPYLIIIGIIVFFVLKSEKKRRQKNFKKQMNNAVKELNTPKNGIVNPIVNNQEVTKENPENTTINNDEVVENDEKIDETNSKDEVSKTDVKKDDN